MNGTLPPHRQPVGMSLVKPCKLQHIIGMLLGIERADHIRPLAGRGYRDGAAARTIRQALDRHDLDLLPAGFDQRRQNLHQARAGALLLILGNLAVEAAGDADEQF